MRLFWRVFLADAAVLTAAAVVLAVSPATVSFPIGPVQALVLAIGLLLMLGADLFLLRRTFLPFERLLRFMRAVDPLRPGRRVAVPHGDPDVRELSQAFNAMLDRLEGERRESALRLLAAQEAERRRLSRELHDEIGQLLTAALLALDRAADGPPPDVAAAVASGRELVESTLDEVRHIARRLRPLALDDLGLRSALVALTTSAGRRGEIEIERRLDDHLEELSADEELVIYRVAQESLTNVIRHARARHVGVVLESQGGMPVLEVEDDGTGLPAGDSRNGSGIRGMRERALLIGAQLDIGPRRGGGTRVRLVLPPRGIA
jgi:two-component system sensor histidine kinase UhpB